MKKPRFVVEGYKQVSDDELVVLQKAIKKYFPALKDVEAENSKETGTTYGVVTATTPTDMCGLNINFDKVLFKEGTGIRFKLYSTFNAKGETQYELETFCDHGRMLKYPSYSSLSYIHQLDRYFYDTDLDALAEELARFGEYFTSVLTNFEKISKVKKEKIEKEFKQQIEQKDIW